MVRPRLEVCTVDPNDPGHASLIFSAIAFAKHPSRTTTALRAQERWHRDASNHELHAGPEPQARHRPEHGRLEFGP